MFCENTIWWSGYVWINFPCQMQPFAAWPLKQINAHHLLSVLLGENGDCVICARDHHLSSLPTQARMNVLQSWNSELAVCLRLWIHCVLHSVPQRTAPLQRSSDIMIAWTTVKKLRLALLCFWGLGSHRSPYILHIQGRAQNDWSLIALQVCRNPLRIISRLC